ncbi:MAG: MarC family protein [Verrucomicrobiota bacterium]|nr:MarC family protein [Verrucomicrobiota bacterium]
MTNFIFSTWVKFFFLFTPFFALSMFLSITKGHTESERHKLAIQICLAVTGFCLLLFFFGNAVFRLFGITLDAFRVGAGTLLFLSAIRLVQGPESRAPAPHEEDIAVVPMAMPVIVGPATIGTLLVLGAEIQEPVEKFVGSVALILAAISVGAILYLGHAIERALGMRGLNILSKITGLVLSALAAQMVLTGVQHFLFGGA